MTITIHVVDDDDSCRRSVARLLRHAGFEVATYVSGKELLEQVTPETRGCVLADMQMPGLDGLQLQTALLQAGATLPVVFLTGAGTIPDTVLAMRQGAVDFLEKTAPRERLLAALQKALDRDLSGEAQRKQREVVRQRFAMLSDREREVLTYVVQGKMNKEIAMDLEIHERTVKLHRAAIMTKLKVQSVADLVRLWVKELGEVEPTPPR